MDALSRDSLFVLTDLGPKFERAYDRYLAAAREFFLRAAETEKQRCVSRTVYVNQRRTPMWYCGYESTDIRECFRVPGGASDAGEPYIDVWPTAMPPSPDNFGDKVIERAPVGSAGSEEKAARDEFRRLWLTLTRMLQGICDLCLHKLLGAKHARSLETTADDLSVSYTFHYHNANRLAAVAPMPEQQVAASPDGGDYGNDGNGAADNGDPRTVTPGPDPDPDPDPDLVVTEHCDPSLFVVEPCSAQSGLEVFLPSLQQWVGAEEACVPGREVIVFCGTALEAATARLALPLLRCDGVCGSSTSTSSSASSSNRSSSRRSNGVGSSSSDIGSNSASGSSGSGGGSSSSSGGGGGGSGSSSSSNNNNNSNRPLGVECSWLPRGGIKATPHRVRFRGGPEHAAAHRFCVIFEQKYGEFYK